MESDSLQHHMVGALGNTIEWRERKKKKLRRITWRLPRVIPLSLELFKINLDGAVNNLVHIQCLNISSSRKGDNFDLIIFLLKL